MMTYLLQKPDYVKPRTLFRKERGESKTKVIDLNVRVDTIA